MSTDHMARDTARIVRAQFNREGLLSPSLEHALGGRWVDQGQWREGELVHAEFRSEDRDGEGRRFTLVVTFEVSIE